VSLFEHFQPTISAKWFHERSRTETEPSRAKAPGDTGRYRASILPMDTQQDTRLIENL